MNKSEKGQKNKINFLIPLIPVIITGICVFLFWDSYYDINDDVAIRNILSGAFAGRASAMAVYVEYPLALVISLLYKFIPMVPWFGFIEQAMLFSCMYLLVYSFASKSERSTVKMVLALFGGILFNAFLLSHIIYVQYTTVAGILAATGAVSFYMLDDKTDSKKFVLKSIPCIACEVLAFSLRPNMFLIEALMIGVAYILKWIKGSKETGAKCFSGKNLIKYFIPLISALIFIAAVFGINKVAYSREGWKEFMKFNDTRTTLYDFQYNFPSYGDNKEFYDSIGWDETDAQILLDYNIAVDDKITEESLSKIVDYNEEAAGLGYFKNGLKQSLWEYRHKLLHSSEVEYAYLLIFLYLAVIVVAVLSKDVETAIATVILFAARSVGWMYLIMRQRFPERVIVPLCFCEAAILVAFMVYDLTKKDVKLKAYIALALVAAALFPFLVTGIIDSNEEKKERETVNAEWEAAKEYFKANDEVYFILDVLSTVRYSERIYGVREGEYANYEIAGGWVTNNPLFAEKLKARQIDNLSEALLEGKAYFAAHSDTDIDWLKKYFESKGIEVSVTREECVSNWTFYSVCGILK